MTNDPITSVRKLNLGEHNSRMVSVEAADAIEADCQRLLQDAIKEQGLNAVLSTREQAALHEAGHAVVATALGVTCTLVQIECKWSAGIKDWGGVTTYSDWDNSISPESSVEDDETNLRMTLAGLLSEVVSLGRNCPRGSSMDELAIGRAIAAGVALKKRVPFESVMVETFTFVGTVLSHNSP